MNYPSIRIEGAILSPDILGQVEELPGQRPADFALDAGARVKDEIARSWADAQDYWRIFQRKLETVKEGSNATTETRNLWMVPLMGLLRYDIEYQARGTELDGRIYAISHRVTNRANTPVQIIGARDPASLDKKPANATRRMSAHALVQEFLNLHDQLYGLVTDGHLLRLLRDSSRLVKQSYLEFDLDRIFTDGLFADFAVLYRLLHATRLPLTNDTSTESLIERYHQDSLDHGARIREGLSKAVEQAILDFGNGFLLHPDNDALRAAVTNADLLARELLPATLAAHLSAAIPHGDRGARPGLSSRRTEVAARRPLREFYSVSRLAPSLGETLSCRPTPPRPLARAASLLLSLRGRRSGREARHRAPGGRALLGRSHAGLLAELHPRQRRAPRLPAVSRALSGIPTVARLIRVNYAALNVEEFGSVYEGLCSNTSRSSTGEGHEPAVRIPSGRSARAVTGSHYTPDDLVQPLIRHSLDHLIVDTS